MFATFVTGATLYIATAIFLSLADTGGTGFTWAPFVNMGGVGLVLAWVLWKLEPRMRGLEAAIERNTRANLVLLLEIKRTSEEARNVAEEMIKEIDEAKRIRGFEQ